MELPASERGKTGLDKLDAQPDYNSPPGGPLRRHVEPLTDGVKGHFTAHGNGAVTDSATGPMWQQSDGGEMTWQKAAAYCRELSLGGFHDWRLPTTAESFSILDHAYSNPALDLAVFSSAEAEYWWTSETRAGDASRAWVTNAGGGAGPHPAAETLSAGGAKRYHVRCARNPQTHGPAPAAHLQRTRSASTHPVAPRPPARRPDR